VPTDRISRSVTHGSCALNGRHAPGSLYAAECPALTAGKRTERARKGAAARWSAKSTVQQASHLASARPDA